VRASARLIAALNAPAARTATLFLAMTALLFRRFVPGRLLQRLVLWFVRKEASCCRAGSPHYKFMERYVARFERCGTFDRARRFLRTRPRLQAARHLDAWVRVGLLGTLRNEILTRHLGTPGVPPRLLNEVQLALSPGCDLACEGCYTAEDRGGAAPRRERIAALVDEAASCGAFVVHVIGKGEPFLSPAWARELLDVIEARPHVFFTVATHGMHIDDALAERMAKLGNLVLLVAVDGPERLHDARRGAGSYRRVHEVLRRLRARGILFGWSCMVSAKSHRHVTSPAFVRAQAEAGAIFGIYSRYFPLASTSVAELALEPADLAVYTGAFEAARVAAPVPLLDLDEVEQHTGCHSRAGESVYIDGITGQVAPCVRVPFAPPDCRVDPAAGRHLADAIAHTFFEQYRQRTGGCPSWCGANLGGELTAVGRLLEPHVPSPPRLVAYHERSGPPVRRLPVLSPESES
jgi:hypothetical protein